MSLDKRRKRVEAIHLQMVSLLRSRSSHVGIWKSVFRGEGYELADIREFAPGDKAKKIHWPTFARTGELHVREDYAARRLKSFLFIDASSSMQSDLCRGMVDTAVTVIVDVSQYWGTPVGAFLFDNKVRETIPPSYDREQLMRIIERIEASHRERERRTTNFTQTLSFLPRVPVRSLIFLLSDFYGIEDGPSEFSRMVASFIKQYDITPVIVDAAAAWNDFPLKRAVITVQDAESDFAETIVLSSKELEKLVAHAEERTQRLRDAFRMCGLFCVVLRSSNLQSCVTEFSECFREKMKQRR